MKTLTINHLAVWAAVVLLHVLGFVWFGPVFGEQWMDILGFDEAYMAANPMGAKHWIMNLIATVAPVYMLAWIFTKIPVESALKGVMIGFGIAFSFVFLTTMTSNLFSGRPYALSWIDGGSSLVAITLAGLVLGAWRKYV